MTDQELRELVADLARSQRETDRQLKETDRQLKETDRHLKETDRQIREVGKQIGGLGEKFGSFTEGLALPSMTKILDQTFGMERTLPRARARSNGHTRELDVLAYSQSRGEAVIVEVKSHLRLEGLDQMRKTLREFRDFFPEHADKKVYGILAVVDVPEELREQVLREGIYLARIHDGQFELQVPEGFQPRAF